MWQNFLKEGSSEYSLYFHDYTYVSPVFESYLGFLFLTKLICTSIKQHSVLPARVNCGNTIHAPYLRSLLKHTLLTKSKSWKRCLIFLLHAYLVNSALSNFQLFSLLSTPNLILLYWKVFKLFLVTQIIFQSHERKIMLFWLVLAIYKAVKDPHLPFTYK